MKAVPKALTEELVRAALDQPKPTDRMKDALNKVLTKMEHPARLARR